MADRVFCIKYRCDFCKRQGIYNIALCADSDACIIPEFRCAKCAGFPPMEQSPPQLIDTSRTDVDHIYPWQTTCQA